MSAPFVTIVSGIRSGSRFPIPAGGLVVGRDADVPGYLEGDDLVSRRHARFISTASGQVLVEDLGSTNGTYVNDIAVTHAVELRHGDLVRIGETYLEFRGGAQSQRRDERPSVRARGGIAIGGSVDARDGSIGAIGQVSGNVDMSRRYDDSSGLGLITRARGAARFVFILGTLVGFIGFGLFAYPILKGIVNAAAGSSAADAASRECDQRYPDHGPAWNDCQFEATRSAGGDFPSFTPWLPLGATLFFAGVVISTAGFFMIRHEP